MEIIKTPVGKILYVDLGDRILLDLIYIEPEFRGQGFGDRHLSQFVHTFGDKEIIIAVSDGFGSDINELVKWYERYGFRTVTSNGYWRYNRMERKANAKN